MPGGLGNAEGHCWLRRERLQRGEESPGEPQRAGVGTRGEDWEEGSADGSLETVVPGVRRWLWLQEDRSGWFGFRVCVALAYYSLRRSRKGAGAWRGSGFRAFRPRLGSSELLGPTRGWVP